MGSHLNKPGVFEHNWKLKSLFEKERECEQAQKKWGGGGGFGSAMPHLICCQVMKCRYLPLKDMCPADMFEIYVSFSLFFFCLPHLILQNSNMEQQKAVWNISRSPPTSHQKEYSRRLRLKMYMQMQSTLEHAQVVNKLTRGRNNSV